MFYTNIGNNNSIEIEAEQWLEDLMDAYGDRLTKIAFSYLKDWGRAQEVVQDVFIICYKKRNQMSQLTSVDAWIYRVTVNRCKDILRTT